MEPRKRFQGMNSASLCSLADRYDNPIPTRFLAPIGCLKIPAQLTVTIQITHSRQGPVEYAQYNAGSFSVHQPFPRSFTSQGVPTLQHELNEGRVTKTSIFIENFIQIKTDGCIKVNQF